MPQGKGPLRIAIEDFLETFGIGDKISKWATTKAENFERSFFKLRQSSLGQLKDIPNLPEQLKASGIEVPGISAQTGIGELLGWGVGIGTQAAGGFMEPITNVIRYAANRLLPTYHPDIGTLAALRFRFPEAASLWDGWAKDLGIDAATWNTLNILGATRIPDSLLLELWLRKELPEDLVRTELNHRGWTTWDVDNLFLAEQVHPSGEQVISLATNNAFDDKVATDYGLDLDMPAEVTEWMTKAGFTPEWIGRYWRSHWKLPGIGDAIGMFQRLRPGRTPVTFTKDDLTVLLRSMGLPAFFQERIIQMGYTPFPSLSIRRLYSAGTIDENEVLQSFLDQGYDETHAKQLTQWVTVDSKVTDKGLTADVYITAYKDGVVTRDEALGDLKAIGYGEDDANFKLSLADYDLRTAALKQETDRLKVLYIAGEYTDQDVYRELGKFNLPALQVQTLLTQWGASLKAKIKLPTDAELTKFYNSNIITRDDLVAGFKKLGYTEKYVAWYLEQIDLDQKATAEKDATTAQTEQTRLATAAKASTYEKNMADIAVAVAMDKLQIATDKVALNTVTDPTQKATLTDEISSLTLEIAQYNVMAAQEKQTKVGPTPATGG